MLRFLLTLAILFATPALASGDALRAKQGELDLKSWSPDDVLYLNGDWHFFWKELLSPSDAVARLSDSAYEGRFVPSGARFRDISPGTDDFSYATYVLKLKNLPSADLSLAALSAYTAAKVFLFRADEAGTSEALVSLGEVSTTAEGAKPCVALPDIVNLHLKAGADYYLLIQVSNFHHDWGGLWIPPAIGSFQPIFDEVLYDRQSSYLVLGMLAIILLYNLSLYLRRPEDKASLYLSIFVGINLIRCLIIAFWVSNTFANLELSYEVNNKVIYLTMLLPIIAFSYFLRACFPKQTPRGLPLAILVIFAVPLAMIVFLPTRTFTMTGSILRISILPFCFYMLHIVYKSYRDREEGAGISMIGGAILIAGVFADVSYSMGYRIWPPNMIGYALVGFTVCQSQIVAVRVASAFRQSEHLSKSLGEEVQRQTREIRSILKHIRQGIFTLLPPNKELGSQYSDHLVTMLDDERIEGRTLRNLVLTRSDLTEDKKQTLEATLDACLGEDPVAFAMNEGNLVRELKFKKDHMSEAQTLEVDWNPIVGKDDRIEKILVSLRDVSEERRLRSMAEQQEEDMSILVELLRVSKEKFQRFTARVHEHLDESRDLLRAANESRTQILRKLFIHMHTIKGAARTYQFAAISDQAHELEQVFLRQVELEWDEEALLQALEGMREQLERYQFVAEKKLGWRGRERAQHVDALASLIAEAARGLDSVARELHKAAPDLVLDRAEVLIDDKGTDLVYSLFLHLFRNSMDHGIESPELRLARGKNPAGRIRVEWVKSGEKLRIRYSDDGNGLDLEALAQVGMKRGLLREEERGDIGRVAQLIFAPGLSTKSSVSKISGRGVGMDAVRTLLEDVGASISLEWKPELQNRRLPFALIIELPPHLFSFSDPSLRNDLAS